YQKAEQARHGEALVAQGAATPGTLTEADRSAVAVYRASEAARQPDPQALQDEMAIRSGGPVGLLTWSVRTWPDYAASSYTITLVMESVAFMLVGMALFKLGVLTGRRSLVFYLALAGAGYALGLMINGAQAIALWRSQFAADAWASQTSYELGRFSVT